MVTSSETQAGRRRMSAGAAMVSTKPGFSHNSGHEV